MNSTAVIEKQVGETPLQAIERFRVAEEIPADVPLAYAGRLDPMASGALLVLIGDACKAQTEFHALDKEYEFAVLLGFKSDTGDVLGMAEPCGSVDAYTSADVYAVAESCIGTFHMQYPVFSSKPVNGKPLFQHVHDGTIADIDIPTTDVYIHTLTFCGFETIHTPDLLQAINEKIEALRLDPNRTQPGNDFRKDAILENWRTLLGRPSIAHTILRFRAAVSSGTYIRALAPVIAEKLGTCGLAYAIHRTRIGDDTLHTR